MHRIIEMPYGHLWWKKRLTVWVDWEERAFKYKVEACTAHRGEDK